MQRSSSKQVGPCCAMSIYGLGNGLSSEDGFVAMSASAARRAGDKSTSSEGLAVSGASLMASASFPSARALVRTRFILNGMMLSKSYPLYFLALLT